MTPRKQSPTPSRRSLLGAFAGGVGLTATATAHRAITQPFSEKKGVASNWDLHAVLSSTSFGDGATIPYFSFLAVGGGSTRGQLPYAEGTEGSPMTVTVTNSLAVAFQPAILGVARGPMIQPGQTASFTFTMPPAGTWLLSAAPSRGPSSPTALANRPTSGLWGTLVSRPASGQQVLYDGGPAYDREYVLLYDDADDRQNAVQSDPRAQLPGPYEPNYYRLNGMGFPDIAADTDTVIGATVGDRVLLRLGNMGHTRQALHMHGFHFDVAAQDNTPEQRLGEKDTIGIPWGKTADIIFTVNQAGAFPFHPHDVQCVTANGLYPYGQLTLIVAS